MGLIVHLILHVFECILYDSGIQVKQFNNHHKTKIIKINI